MALQPAFRRFMDEVLAVFAAEANGVPAAGEGGRRQGDGERDVSVRLFPVFVAGWRACAGSAFCQKVSSSGGMSLQSVATSGNAASPARVLRSASLRGGRSRAWILTHAHSGIPRFWLLCGR